MLLGSWSEEYRRRYESLLRARFSFDVMALAVEKCRKKDIDNKEHTFYNGVDD